MKTKITIFMLLCLIINILSIKAYVYANEQILLGDVNQDNKVSIRDATLIQMHIAKMEPYANFSYIQSKCADVNENNKITISDATAIQKHRVGINTKTRINQYIEINEQSTSNKPTTQPTTSNEWLPGFFD